MVIGDQRRASDIEIPDAVTTQLDPETVIAQVAAPRVVVEEEIEGEGIEGEEGEAAEGAEGEAGGRRPRVATAASSSS